MSNPDVDAAVQQAIKGMAVRPGSKTYRTAGT